jgi:hypothetical protein
MQTCFSPQLETKLDFCEPDEPGLTFTMISFSCVFTLAESKALVLRDSICTVHSRELLFGMFIQFICVNVNVPIQCLNYMTNYQFLRLNAVVNVIPVHHVLFYV